VLPCCKLNSTVVLTSEGFEGAKIEVGWDILELCLMGGNL
jgi:hypothetical protein